MDPLNDMFQHNHVTNMFELILNRINSLKVEKNLFNMYQ